MWVFGSPPQGRQTEYDAFSNAQALQETPHQESQQVLLKDIEVVSLFCVFLL